MTLREEVDAEAATSRLDEIGALRSLSALNEKVTLLRLLDRLDEAWDVANEAVRRTRFAGDRAELLSSRIRRARVMQAKGKLDDSLSELGLCVEESRTHEWHVQHAVALHHRGLVRFEMGDYEIAARDFDAAVALGERIGADEAETERSRVAFAAATELHEQALRDEKSDAPARGRRRADDSSGEPPRHDAARTE